MKSLSGKRMCKVLEKNGWARVKTKSGHRKYKKPGQAPVIVPFHGNQSLPESLQRAIMKQAGLTEDDL